MKRLGVSSTERVRGFADALGIRLSPVGNCLVMTEADFARVEAAFKKAGRRKSETASAS